MKKTETVADFLKRGGKIKKLATPTPEKEVSADLTEKAQPSFFEQPVEQLISENFGLPLDNEADNGNVYAFYRRQAAKLTSAGRR